jgi:hypothetical protein
MTRRSFSPQVAAVIVAVATTVMTAVSVAVPTQAAAAPTPSTSSATSLSGAVVVVLKDQLATTPAGRTHGTHRTSLAQQAQQSVLTHLPGAKPGRLRQFSVGNAFAATVSPAQAAALAANPAVAAVVPDVSVPMTPSSAQPKSSAAIASSAVCPADPAHPLLEPEGLGLVHAASSDGTSSAADLANGSGVKVGVLADGVDTDVPDFVRPNGQNVVTEQDDFTGVPTSGGEETTGDITTIAAQGTVHDLHDANPSIPTGCTVKIVGVAPGANIVALSGIGLFTPLSDVLEGIDYATNVAHVDVLNESFGVDAIPNAGARNALQLFNDEAVDAGITVVAASGDAGVTNTMGSPAVDPAVISVGATTSLRSVAQQGITGTNGQWANNNIAEFSSSGFTSTGSTVDLVAPGYEGWVASGSSTAKITPFGGTSESAPYVAGAAALVIQAYRQFHKGVSPSPDLVKRLITSTADDLGANAQDQGAGLLDARSAVEAAITFPTATGQVPASVGSHVTLSSAQLNLLGAPGSTKKATETVTNVGTKALTVAPSMRRFAPIGTDTQTLSPAGGVPTTVTLNPVSCDQLRVRVYNKNIVAGSGHIELFASDGTLENLSAPQGNAGYAMLTAPCLVGSWTLQLPAALSGPTTVETDAFQNTPIGQVSPAAFTLAPGASRKVTATVTVPADGGDTAYSLEVATSNGHTASAPVTVRTVLSLGAGNTTLAGTFTGGNGRNTFGNQQRFVYAVDVPAGAAALHTGFTLNVPAGQQPDAVQGDLVTPTGEIADQSLSGSLLGIFPPSQDNSVSGFDLTTLAPTKGRWLVVLTDIGASQSIGQSFTATMSMTSPATVASTALSMMTKRPLPAGQPVTVPVTVTNSGANPMVIQADPRTTKTQTYQLSPTLLGIVPVSSVQSIPTLFFSFGVPLGTKSITAISSAAIPTLVSLQSPGNGIFVAGDMKQATAGSTVSTATVSESSPTVTPGVWGVTATTIGPFTSVQPQQTATITGSVVTAGFDRTMTVAADDTSLIGADPYLPYVDPSVPTSPYSLAQVEPGGSLTFRMTITPTGKPGTVVHGVLNIVTDSGATGIAALPYTYTVGSPVAGVAPKN